ncbi:MAG: PaaI family thioesterase [Sneathiella sp.]|nr:PaaI family thioesterase [Sneathiella sp.]
MELPEGFEPHFRKSDFTAPWEPIFSKRNERNIQLGIFAAAPHTNSRGFVHGGLIAALADNAMGLSCVAASSDISSLVTVNLGTDFLSSARIGQWVLFDTEVIKIGRTLCFASCLVTADGKPVARTNATFSVMGAKDTQRSAA